MVWINDAWTSGDSFIIVCIIASLMLTVIQRSSQRKSDVWDMMADLGFPAPPPPTAWQEVSMHPRRAIQLKSGFEEHYACPPHLGQPPVHFIPSPPFSHTRNNDSHFVLQEHVDLRPVGLIDGNMVYEIPSPQPQQPPMLKPELELSQAKKRRRKRRRSHTDSSDSALTHTHSDTDAPAVKKNGLVATLLPPERLEEQDQTLSEALSVGEELLLMLEQMKPLSPPCSPFRPKHLA
ncbi:uncharacterized protein LOC128748253 isoform X3 [Synchiropus splendidus]|uniref:uncharacterized protein LOC128748253 isoform X3 n=1 Tax=Synchiropus splendidus TaxID=270530 RepID=UPI00237DEBBD|nr:uncharacterized protein LOC128748253 isoform X3 [Synchiropus splendidus]